MILKYFLISEYGDICRYEIDTDDRYYVKHTDDDVFINEGYGSPTEYTLKFEVAKKQLVERMMKRLLEIQEMAEDDLDFP